MPARLFLLLILLIHPARGVLAAELQRTGAPAETCGQACCPLCAELDACPCNAGPDDPTPLPEPAAPIDTKQATPVLPHAAALPISEASRADALPRAEPASSLRSLDASVNAFLSRVCVWTT